MEKMPQDIRNVIRLFFGVLGLILLLAGILSGCALSGQYATHVLRDGSHLQTFWFDNKNPDALNSNMTLAFHCAKLRGQEQENCDLVAQGYGTGEGILLKFFQGGATAASIGAVGATGGFKDTINVSQTSGNAIPGVTVNQTLGVNQTQLQQQAQTGGKRGHWHDD